jgi:hypothetical protein
MRYKEVEYEITGPKQLAEIGDNCPYCGKQLRFEKLGQCLCDYEKKDITFVLKYAHTS